ncbi:unnamed protein product [Pieris macdunnoughi]|uniref:Uncharacterized protein n=1 Tax=Pieris macdunnoughi TaxID=345717 RepID=A0A821XR25_9NEOP|nr:unnamed protein product [Pieris macdunnoughi]
MFVFNRDFDPQNIANVSPPPYNQQGMQYPPNYQQAPPGYQYPMQGQPGYPGAPGYPAQGYPGHPGHGSGYPASPPTPGIADMACCASCMACLSCLLCSCCQNLMGGGMGHNGDHYNDESQGEEHADVEPPHTTHDDER